MIRRANVFLLIVVHCEILLHCFGSFFGYIFAFIDILYEFRPFHWSTHLQHEIRYRLSFRKLRLSFQKKPIEWITAAHKSDVTVKISFRWQCSPFFSSSIFIRFLFLLLAFFHNWGHENWCAFAHRSHRHCHFKRNCFDIKLTHNLWHSSSFRLPFKLFQFHLLNSKWCLSIFNKLSSTWTIEISHANRNIY